MNYPQKQPAISAAGKEPAKAVSACAEGKLISFIDFIN
jgi:hypothetical protein